MSNNQKKSKKTKLTYNLLLQFFGFKSVSHLFQTIDTHFLAIYTGFLLAFIPLYPKIPLFSPIEQYIVRVRLEDLFILIGFILWGIYLIRGKISINKPIFYAFAAYIGVGFLSILSAIFLIGTVPAEPLHVGKTVLHYARYIQYFSLFFIAFSAIQSKKQLKILLATICLTVLAISIYGYGQRHYYWPVYSTMNREFSKGIRLYLTEHARVQSTFAGHYDLGAYLVIILPLILAAAFQVQRVVVKTILHITHVIGIWLLVVSAARTSFAGYVVGVTLICALLAALKKTWKERIWWFLSRYASMGIIISYLFIFHGNDMYDRLLQVLKSYPETYQQYEEFQVARKEFTEQYILIPFGLKNISLPKAEVPENGISTDELESVLVRSDTRPTSEKPTIQESEVTATEPDTSQSRPRDVYVDIPDIIKVATTSADGSTQIVYEERDRTYSDNALRYGLSLAIRLDTLWPQAIDGFMKNPLLGSGYATLNKQHPYDFTEADSTDNNFLRTLGETGALGFITFYGIIFMALGYAVAALRSKDPLLQAFAIAYIAGTTGLFINAFYIDVFAASKVAQVFWAITGLFVAYYYLDIKEHTHKNTKK